MYAFSLGGTEKFDGFWSSLRRLVGRRAVNTGRLSATAKRAWFDKNVRVAQWHWWHLHSNRFELVGSYLKSFREDSAFF